MKENEERCNLQILDECLVVGSKVDTIQKLYTNQIQLMPNCVPAPNLNCNPYRNHSFTFTDKPVHAVFPNENCSKLLEICATSLDFFGVIQTSKTHSGIFVRFLSKCETFCIDLDLKIEEFLLLETMK